MPKRERPSSATARLIALATIALRHHREWGHLVPADAAEASRWFLETGARGLPLRPETLSRAWLRGLLGAAERLALPGISLHYALRKRFLETVVRRSLAEGYRQVVVLGAGYDTLAFRLHREFPHALFVEADHPATQRTKREALEGRAPPMPNLRFVTLDLAEDFWEASLLALPCYDPQAKTLVIAEGVLMYLRPEAVEGVFRGLREHVGPAARFAFSFLEPRPDGGIAFRNASRLVGLWLWLRGEPFRWGIRRQHLASYLERRGFILRELLTPDILRARSLAGRSAAPALPEGEYLCVADRV